jgi:hypothetical protein
MMRALILKSERPVKGIISILIVLAFEPARVYYFSLKTTSLPVKSES